MSQLRNNGLFSPHQPSPQWWALLACFAACLWLSLGLYPEKQPVQAKSKVQQAGIEKTVTSSFSPFPPMVHPIRIGLMNRSPMARIAVWTPGAVFIDTHPIFTLKPGLVYTLSAGRITELATGRSCALPVSARAQIAAPDYRIWTNNRWWRGSLEIICFGNNVNVINLLDLEEYLLGVVPSEMPASWHQEALKAQAVAARSYAIAHMGPGASKWLKTEGYDLVPDVRDQAYKGLAVEAPSTFWAVRQTRGIVLKNANKVKPGFYRAWVGDSDENLNIRRSSVSDSVLQKITGVSNIVGMTVKQFTPDGNAHSIQVMGQKKTREVSGVALAKMLGFSTAGILDVKEEGANWIFTYRGPGNGARGLSQHGANMFAARGWRFDQILTQYYQDADGQLRLDYVDHYHPMRIVPVMAKPKPEPENVTASDGNQQSPPAEKSE